MGKKGRKKCEKMAICEADRNTFEDHHSVLKFADHASSYTFKIFHFIIFIHFFGSFKPLIAESYNSCVDSHISVLFDYNRKHKFQYHTTLVLVFRDCNVMVSNSISSISNILQ